MKLVDLGWCLARLDVQHSKLTIVSPSCDEGENGTYGPAESVVVYGLANITALRDALNEAYL